MLVGRLLLYGAFMFGRVKDGMLEDVPVCTEDGTLCVVFIWFTGLLEALPP